MKIGEFIEGVRFEAKRVVWPKQEETLWTTVSVVVFVFGAAGYFIITDTIIFTTFKKLLGIG
ncbi:MAG: preprotein translocase subunit SecE [Holosporales bacterium]|jgi:preprotein translocase SecE subunit|nr:preprotein translocase subunit SecE [Holosporales bacterium]